MDHVHFFNIYRTLVAGEKLFTNPIADEFDIVYTGNPIVAKIGTQWDHDQVNPMNPERRTVGHDLSVVNSPTSHRIDAALRMRAAPHDRPLLGGIEHKG